MSIAVPWGRRRDSVLELLPRVDLTAEATQSPSVGIPAATEIRRASWQRSYLACLLGLDAVGALVAAGWTVAVTPVPLAALLSPVPIVAVAAWLGLLMTRRVYEFRHLLVGTEEYRRIVGAGLVSVVLLALVDSLWAVPHQAALLWVLAPSTVAVDVGLRAVARGVVRYRQRAGQLLQRTVVVGPHSALADLVGRLQRDPSHGMEVVGACYLDRDLHLRPVPTRDLGGVEDILLAARGLSADQVLVAPGPGLTGPELRRLAWDLERSGAELVVAPGVVEVAGSRLTVRSVTSLPLLHVDQPRHSGLSYALKTATDRIVALALLLLAAPALGVLALLIRRDGGGSLYRQTRIGQNGRPFTMLKLRTMCQDAEQWRDALLAEGKQHDGPLFKLRQDPRVTPIGRFHLSTRMPSGRSGSAVVAAGLHEVLPDGFSVTPGIWRCCDSLGGLGQRRIRVGWVLLVLALS